MVKKTIKYEDFNGQQVEETLYFNLTQTEQTRMELSKKDGLSNYIKEAVESGDNAALLDLFTNLILESYGIKSEDGKRFIKSPKLKEEFAQSAAFDALFMEIATNPEAAEAFVKGITNR